RRLRGIEPRGSERDVDGPGHLSRRFGGAARRDRTGDGNEDEQRNEEASNASHGKPPYFGVFVSSGFLLTPALFDPRPPPGASLRSWSSRCARNRSAGSSCCRWPPGR